MPHAKKTFEAYGGDERVRVVAVATAFEKDQYPWMADETKIKERLKQDGMEFPVMRDKDEKSVKLVGMGGSYGTPMTLVLDAEGIVRWHGFNASEQTSAEVDAVIEQLLESFFVAAIPDLHRELREYESGKYASAYKKAQKLVADETTDDELRGHAELVIQNIDAAVDRQLAQAEQKRAGGHPDRALAVLDNASKAFKGIDKAGALDEKLAAWKKDKDFKAEQKAGQELEKALEKLAKDPDKGKKAALKKLEKLLADCAGSPVAPRVKAALDKLQ